MTDPNLVSKLTLFRRTFNFKNILIFLIIAFMILTYFAKVYPYFNSDLIITQTIQQFRPLWFDQLMIIISILGNFEWAITSTLIVSITIFLFGKRKESLMVAVASLGSILISQFFKYIVARPRPDSSLIIQIGTYLRADSFPSGHVMFYVSFYGFLVFLIYIFLKKRALRVFLMLLFSLPIILGGLSRIYLGVHWFSDVLGAYLIGLIWLLILIHVYQGLKVRQKNN